MTSLLHAITAALLVASRATATPPDPCALLTKSEAEAIVGKPIPPPSPSGTQCHYGEEGSSDEIIVYQTMLMFKSKEEFHAYLVKDTEKTNARIQEAMGKAGATVKPTTVDPVPGVGESAYYVEPSLVVFKRGRVLSIISGDRKHAVAAAAKVVPRFGSP
jgi:hypothetical protein